MKAAYFRWKKLVTRRVLGDNKKQVFLKSYFLKILCVYIHVYPIIKNGEPGLYNSLCHTNNGKYISGFSLMQ